MKRLLFIYNPMSGNGMIIEHLDQLIAKMMEDGKLVTLYRIEKKPIIDLNSLMKEEFDEIVIAGGDGTVNSVVNAMREQNKLIPILVLPTGTCNDFAASIGIGQEIEKSVSLMTKEKIRQVDIGRVNEKHCFVGTLAGGIFVNVSFETSNDLKKAFGPTAYYIKGLTEVPNIKPFSLTITTEKETFHRDDALMFFVTNGSHAGGFSKIVEDVDIEDGYMDIIVIKNCLHVELVGLFFKALRNHLLDDRNVFRIRAKECRIESDRDIILSVDGERGDHLPVQIEVVKHAIPVFSDIEE